MSTDTPRWRRRKEARPAEIIDAALAEFARKGLSATRIDDIARRAGITKGTVYLYFDSKDRLFEEVVRQHVVPRVENIALVAADRSGPAADVLAEMMGMIFRELVMSDLRQILRMLIAEGGRFPHLVEYYYREVISRALDAFEGILRRGVAEGAFRDGAVVDFPHILAGSGVAAAVWKMLFDDLAPVDLDRLCAVQVDIMIAGLRA